MLDFNGNEPKEIRYDDGIRLPEGYTRLEYIESTGTQYIDTGIKANDLDKINMQFSLTNNNGIYGIFGGGWTSNQVTFQLIYNTATNQIAARCSNISTFIQYDTKKHYIELSKDYITIDETTVTGTSTINDIRTVFLFARRKNNNATSGIENYSYCRIYSCKIWDNNTLVRNFIPAKRNSDNELGLYDTVNDVFYTNQGTGEFVAGQEYKGHNVAKVVYNGTVVWKGLPSAYTRLEYIESTGTQYIDTGVTPNNTTDIELTFKTTSTIIDWQRIFGQYVSNRFEMLMNNTNLTSWYLMIAGNRNDFIIDTTESPKTIKFISGTGFYINGVLVKSILDTETNDRNILLMRGYDRQGAIQIYSTRIWRNNTLVRNYIPARRNSDNEVGLYDTVTDTFYTNAGTGSFIAGEYNLAA